MVDRTKCRVLLFVGDTLNCATLVASSDEYDVLGLVEHFGDYKLREYSIQNNTLYILIGGEICEFADFECAELPMECVEIVEVMW